MAGLMATDAAGKTASDGSTDATFAISGLVTALSVLLLSLAVSQNRQQDSCRALEFLLTVVAAGRAAVGVDSLPAHTGAVVRMARLAGHRLADCSVHSRNPDLGAGPGSRRTGTVGGRGQTLGFRSVENLLYS